MDPATVLFFGYRILIVFGGILTIYLGYRLFYLTKEKQGDLSIKTGTQLELKFKDVAPGVFFALFGAAVLSFSLIHGLSITYPHQVSGVAQATPTACSAATPTPTASTNGGVNPSPGQPFSGYQFHVAPTSTGTSGDTPGSVVTSHPDIQGSTTPEDTTQAPAAAPAASSSAGPEPTPTDRPPPP